LAASSAVVAGPGSFLQELARQLGVSAQELLNARPLPRHAPVASVPSLNVDVSAAAPLHTRLMPAGWAERKSFTEFAPGALFTVAA
jgi:hypothetical protein